MVCIEMGIVSLWNDFKIKINLWRYEKYLHKHGCRTQRQFDLKYDEHCNLHLSRIKDIYFGYKYVYCFENMKHYAYKPIYDYGPGGYKDGYHEIMEWCEKYCQGKWRNSWHRVIKNWIYKGNQYECNFSGTI